jgi:hypothetical protein
MDNSAQVAILISYAEVLFRNLFPVISIFAGIGLGFWFVNYFMTATRSIHSVDLGTNPYDEEYDYSADEEDQPDLPIMREVEPSYPSFMPICNWCGSGLSPFDHSCGKCGGPR